MFLRWGTHLYMSLFPFVCPTICRAPYLKNHTSCDHNFWYTYVKWLKDRRYTCVKGQKIAQNEKYNLHPSHTLSPEQYSIWSWFLVHFKMTSPGVVLFYQNLDFSGCCGVKGQKMAQNDKKNLSVLLHISKSIHHMIVICGTQV